MPLPLLEEPPAKFFRQGGDTVQAHTNAMVLRKARSLGTVDARQAQLDARALDRLGIAPLRIHALVVVQHRRPESQRLAGLQIARFPSDQPIADGVALAESVMLELGELQELLARQVPANPLAGTGTDELLGQRPQLRIALVLDDALVKALRLGGAHSSQRLHPAAGILL